MVEKLTKWSIFFVIFVIIFTAVVDQSPDIQQFLGDVTSTDYARITDVDYKAVLVDEKTEFTTDSDYDRYGYYIGTVGSQSKVVVTETITFDVRAASKDNLFWELWIGLGEEEIDGLRRTYKVNSVKEVLPDGTKISWEESPQLYWDDEDYASYNTYLGPNKWYHSKGPYNESARRYECLMFYVDGIYREKITFEIEYEIYNAVLQYGDCSELYIPMYSGDTVKHLNSFKGEILIANKDMPREGNYEATGFGTKNGSFDMEKSTTKYDGYTTFSFDLNKKDLKFLKGYEYLEFDMYSMGEDKHIFADYATPNIYSTSPALDEVIENRNYYLDAADRHQMRVAATNVIVLFIGLMVLLLGIVKFMSTRGKHPALKAENKSNYTFRDIPSNMDPKLAAELVFIKDSKPPKNNEDAVYASLLLSLARKQYIKIVDCGNDTMIKILQNDANRPTQMPNTSQFNQYPNQPRFYPNMQWQPNQTYNSQTQRPMPYSPQSGHTSATSQPRYGIANEIYEVADKREPLTYCERQYYNLLLRHVRTGHITIKDLQKRIAADSKFSSDFQDKIQTANLNDAGKHPYTTHRFYLDVKNKLKKLGKNYIKLGIAVLTVGNLFSMWSAIGRPLFACFAIGIASILFGICTIARSKYYISLTPFGEQEYQKWRGLYNFLKSDTLLTERTHVELPLWEKYLVYATAFGISEKVVEAIRIRCITVPPQTSIASTNHYHIRHICSRSASVRRSIHTSSHSYRSATYGSGYSAGGRGIGGGGGGH